LIPDALPLAAGVLAALEAVAELEVLAELELLELLELHAATADTATTAEKARTAGLRTATSGDSLKRFIRIPSCSSVAEPDFSVRTTRY
jgi:hypothetical protein